MVGKRIRGTAGHGFSMAESREAGIEEVVHARGGTAGHGFSMAESRDRMDAAPRRQPAVPQVMAFPWLKDARTAALGGLSLQAVPQVMAFPWLKAGKSPPF